MLPHDPDLPSIEKERRRRRRRGGGGVGIF